MRVITIHRLSMRFDADERTNGTPTSQALRVVDAINETMMANQSVFSGAHIFAAPDEIEVTVEDKEE